MLPKPDNLHLSCLFTPPCLAAQAELTQHHHRFQLTTHLLSFHQFSQQNLPQQIKEPQEWEEKGSRFKGAKTWYNSTRG